MENKTKYQQELNRGIEKIREICGDNNDAIYKSTVEAIARYVLEARAESYTKGADHYEYNEKHDIGDFDLNKHLLSEGYIEQKEGGA